MLEAKDLINATLVAGRELLRTYCPEPPSVEARRTTGVLVPIRSLGENHRDRIAQHLLSLSPQDRSLRFGYAAQDSHIGQYVAGLDFERDEIFGIYNRKLILLAVAHLAYAKTSDCESCAEFGVSVLAAARGRGYGARLFERAAMHAGNDGIHVLFIHALSENQAMLKIARDAGARVVRDGSESEAFLQLPRASLDSRVSEMLAEQLAQTDYRVKVQAQQFRAFLAGVQTLTGLAKGQRDHHPR
ncbi:MAG: GNAT family N-acetyltransferase [Rhodoferax sp.]|nr:GNAT family N-acetyltransferase [Rhodoferax sp.]MCF8208191.1 GNAT family N-acetyltransferase [Rhodoferax sp.]